jgi:hypothetical protein
MHNMKKKTLKLKKLNVDIIWRPQAGTKKRMMGYF